MSIESPSSVGSAIEGLKKSVDDVASYFSDNAKRSTVYNFDDPTAKTARDNLRTDVNKIQKEIEALKSTEDLSRPHEMSRDEVRSFLGLKKMVAMVEREIQSLDTQIKEKTSTPGWLRVLCFWRNFAPKEDPVPDLKITGFEEIMQKARKGFIDQSVEPNVEERVKELGASGIWAIEKGDTEGKMKLCLSPEANMVTKIDIEVTSTGYKVENKIFDTLQAIADSKQATSKLSDAEKRLFPERVKQRQTEIKAEDPRSEEDALRFMNTAKRLLGESEGRYALAKTSDEKVLTLFVEGPAGVVTKRQIHITERGRLQDGDKVLLDFSKLALAPEKRASVQVEKEAPMLIAKNRSELEAGVATKTTQSQQGAKSKELEKIVSGLQKEAVGTSFLVSGANQEQYLIFVDSDLKCKSRRVEIHPEKVILTDGKEIREFASFETLKTALQLKDFDAMDKLHRERNAKIADVKAALNSIAVLPKGQSIGTEEKARQQLKEAISYLGGNADYAYVIFEEKGMMHLAFVQGKEVLVRVLDITSNPGSCLVFASEGQRVTLLDNVPSGPVTQETTKALRERFQKQASNAGYVLAEENSWTSAQELAKQRRTELIKEAGSAKDNLQKTANEFAELLGNLGLDTNVGAYAISNASREGLLAIDVVTQNENEAPKVERLLVDVGVVPGKFVVAGKEYDTIGDLSREWKLTKKIEVLRKERNEQIKKSRELLAVTKDFAVKVSSPDEAKNMLSSLVEALKDSGVSGGYLFRAPGGSSLQQASFWKGALNKVASGMGAGYVSYLWQRFGWGVPSAEFTVSFYRKLEDGKYALEEYKVPLEQGQLKYGGAQYKSLPEVVEAIKLEKGIMDLKGIAEMREMRDKIEAHKTGIEKDKGFNGSVGMAWQAATNIAWGASALAAYIPKVGAYVPQVSSYPVPPQDLATAEKQLSDVHGLVPEATYMIYTLPTSKFYQLSVIKDDGTKEHYSIDIVSKAGSCVIRDKEGKEKATHEKLNEAIKTVTAEAKPFTTQWYEYQAKQRLRPTTLAIEGPAPVVVEQTVKVEVEAEGTIKDQAVSNLRNLLSLSKENSPPADKATKELWLAMKDIKEVTDEKTLQTQGRKLLRAIFDLVSNSKLENLRTEYKRLTQVVHPDKKNFADAQELFQLLGSLYTNAKLT